MAMFHAATHLECISNTFSLLTFEIWWHLLFAKVIFALFEFSSNPYGREIV